jgi:archaellum component FlaC
MSIPHEEITLGNSKRIEKISDTVCRMGTDVELIKNDVNSLKTSNEKIEAKIESFSESLREQSIFIDKIKSNSEKAKNIIMFAITNVNNIIIFLALIYLILSSFNINILELLKK